MYHYLFGPVPSRRLGRSLGVDLVPIKTCSFNCVFCQVGTTPHPTALRREYVPTQAVVDELAAWVIGGGEADVVTLSGSGEPTLHSRFGDVLRAIHRLTPHKAALLTNSSLLHDPEVRRAAAAADVVKASLGAWDQASLERLNRPLSGVVFDDILSGLTAFRREFTGALWLEVFIVPGINDSADSVRRLAELTDRIQPDRVHLNTAVRPPAESDVHPVDRARLRELADLFTPSADVIASFDRHAHMDTEPTDEDVLALLARRPCRTGDVAAGLGVADATAAQALRILLQRNCVATDGEWWTLVAS